VASTPLRRKTVTVLVADVEFIETLDPELLRETSLRSVGAVQRVLEAHGGTIEQRAGDEVMAVFGVPRAHEDDALRAARAALELQAEILPPFGLRIGIEAGEVLAGADEAGHGFVAGAAITLAKRLQQQAPSGEVLAGPAARRLLGRAVEAEQSSEAEAEAFLLRRVVEDVPVLPRNLEAPLADRALELAELHETFGATIDEQTCHLFLLLGEPGIGKTRLSRELTAELNGTAMILVGRCVSYGRGATYLPLVEIIRQVEARSSLGDLLAGDDHAALIEARLVELIGEEGSASGGETFWAVRRLFEALAAKQPVMLVFEDLHWAEATLFDLIEYLAAAEAPIFLLGLARPELLEKRPAWREIDRRRLAPLSSDDGVILIQNLGPVPDELRTKILGTAGGNPLFIEQLLAHVAEQGELETLPPSLESLLASRLDRLELGEQSVLQHAAVAGREFSLDALVELLPEREAAFAHLLALGRKGLIRESPREPGEEANYAFHHVLIRDVAYGTLPKARRADLHERYAHWLKARPDSADEVIGFHLEQAFRHRAELGSDEVEARGLATEAGERLAAAGLRAAKSGDAPAAANLLTRASSLLETDEVVRRDLLAELGLVLWLGGDLQSAERTFGAALDAAISTHDRRAELRARLERAFLKLFRAPEGAADALRGLAQEAIPELEQLEDDRTLGRYWYVLAHVRGGFHCRYRESAEAAERAIVHFERSAWPLAPCLQELAASLYIGPVEVEDGIRHCQRLLAEADRGGQANVLVFQAGLEAMAARFEVARELVARAQAIYEELAWTEKISANCAAIAADIELLAGNHVGAERLLRESCERLEAAGDRARLATQGAQLGEALYRQGRFDEARHWSGVAEASAATDDASAQFSWRALRAKGLARGGALDEANALAQAAVQIATGTDALSQHAKVLFDHAEVLRLAGHTGDATVTAENAVLLLERKGNVAAIRGVRSLLPELAGT
jgi:class 3 adenylate cyclase